MKSLDVTWAVLIGLAIATVLVSWLVPRALLANAMVLALAAVKGRRSCSTISICARRRRRCAAW
jgi:hypothetical protein